MYHVMNTIIDQHNKNPVDDYAKIISGLINKSVIDVSAADENQDWVSPVVWICKCMMMNK